MLSPPPVKRLELAFLFLLSLALFTFGLSHHEFIQFESRFAVFAQEMLNAGISFFPTTYGAPYPDYPAAYTILVYLFALPLHKVTALSAILPTAIAASMTILFIYLIGCLHARLLGIYAVLFAFFTFDFLAFARTITLDQFVCTVTAACFYQIYAADFLNKKPNWLLIILCWLIGFAIRGPIGLIIPASVVAGYYLMEKNRCSLAITLASAAVLLTFCICLLLGAAWWQGGAAFVHEVIRMQAVGRVSAANATPFYYYFTYTFIDYALAFPIAIILLIVYRQQIWRENTNPHFRLLKLLAVWLFIILIGMSIPSDAKMRYILPITPAISLMAGHLLYWQHDNRALNYLKAALRYACIALPFLSLFLITVAYLSSAHLNMTLEIAYGWIYAALIVIGVLTVFYQKKLAGQQAYLPGAYMLGALTFIVLYGLAVQPLIVQFNRARPFVEKVESLRQPAQALVFYQIGPDGEDIKYRVAAARLDKPLFIQQPAELLNFSGSALFIAKAENFSQLDTAIKNHFKIVFAGRLGHQECVVFTAR